MQQARALRRGLGLLVRCLVKGMQSLGPGGRGLSQACLLRNSGRRNDPGVHPGASSGSEKGTCSFCANVLLDDEWRMASKQTCY